MPSLTESRFRYREVAPENISVPVAELLGKLPEQYRGRGDGAAEQRVDIPCRDLLGGNTPRMSLGRLEELLPDLVVIPEGEDRGNPLHLPAGWLALHFGLITRLEEVPLAERKDEAGVDDAAGKLDATVTAGGSSDPVSDDAKADGGGLDGQSSFPEAVRKRSIFDSLPIFRRHRPAEVPLPETSAPGPALEASVDTLEESLHELQESRVVPDPVTPEVVVVDMAEPDHPAEEEVVPVFPAEPEAPNIKESANPTTVVTEVTVERLWKLDPSDQIADAAALQSLFMTEEKLTLDRVIGMAGSLPGLRACVLAHGEQVICAPSNASGIDLRTLSTQAMTMLSQIRESSSKMGLGSVPAVTLHADQGTLSFLHKGELCLLVLHADRGFIPGVRERLQDMLGHLVDARPALPGKSPGRTEVP